MDRWEPTSIPWAQCSPDRQEKLYEAWRAGFLDWKLDPVQRDIVRNVYASHPRVKSSMQRIYVLDLGRRSGKDRIMATIAAKTAMTNDRGYIRIPYAAPTREDAQNILVPIFEDIFKDCPPELLPYELRKGTFRTNSPELNFDNGAQIALIGVELHPERLRGTNTHAMFMTEMAFVDDFEHIFTSIIMPQLLTQRDGFVVLGSTPPVTPGHYWSTKIVPDAKLRGMYDKRTVYENPRLGPEDIQGAIEMCGGEKTTKFRREFLCEHVTESTLAYVPEFADVKDVVVTTEGFDKIPEWRDTYTSMDPGFAHATGTIFAYEDFERGLIMIEGCFKTVGLNSSEVARRVKAREWQLWGRVPTKPAKYSDAAWAEELELIRSHFYPGITPPAKPVATWLNNQAHTKTYRRISDTDSRLIADLNAEHGLLFFATEKENVEAHRNAMCLNIQRKRYRIHPRCVELITDLEQATWNKARTKLAEQAGGGHFDTVKALEYLNRNLTSGRNPFPPTQWDRHTHHVPKSSGKTRTALANMFTRRR